MPGIARVVQVSDQARPVEVGAAACGRGDTRSWGVALGARERELFYGSDPPVGEGQIPKTGSSAAPQPAEGYEAPAFLSLARELR
jgi:hypothetical protein